MDQLFARAKAPDDVGIPSTAVVRLLDRIAELQITMHGFMVVRGGKVAAEAYWAPFDAAYRHRMYSISKSFVSLAVGCLIDEGKLQLTDEVHQFFPDKLPQKLHPYLQRTTVRDLLTMATPHAKTSYTVHDKDWLWTFFNTEPSHPSGTIFSYDTAGTVVLCTIVERLTGMPFIDYLRPRLLGPIGASKDIHCIRTPEGTAWGGSGVLCTLEDMAKVAWVCMNHGRWGNEQLLPQDYVDAATSKQIDNSHLGEQGYGYQIWRMRRNGFYFYGMGGQYAFCFPDEDLVFACTADTQSDPLASAKQLQEAVYSLLDSLAPASIPIDPSSNEALAQRLASLALVPLKGEMSSPRQLVTSGIWYRLNPNPMGITRMRFVFDKEGGVMEYENKRGLKQISFALRGYRQGEFPEYYFDEQIGTICSRHYRCLSTAAWTEPSKLYIRVCIADTYFGGLQIVVAFKGENEISVQMLKVAEWFLEDYQGFAGGIREE